MEISRRFDSYMKPEEAILWCGQPKQGIQLRDADIILIPMSIILIGFSVIIDYTLLQYDSGILFKLFGVLLGIAGLYMGLIRFLSDAIKRAHTYYCITTKRVIVLTGRNRTLIKTLPLKNIDRMDRTDEKDGSGFIIFGNTNPLYPWLLGGFYFVHDAVPGLEMLTDVKQVYDLISKQVKVELPAALMATISKEKANDLN